MSSASIRRALGARRRDITTCFHLKNMAITLTGCLLGIFFALDMNLFLQRLIAAPAISVSHLFAGAFLMLLISQAAIHFPARHVA